MFQDGATGSRNGEAEDEDGGPPLREQTPSSRGDSANDGSSTNNNSVGIMKRSLFSLFYIIANFISLGFGLSVRQSKQFENVSLGFGNYFMTIFS